MPAAWSKKDERQYRHIVDSCLGRRRSEKTCKRIAAATVNKQRRREGRTLGDMDERPSRWDALGFPLVVLTTFLLLKKMQE